ncbi:MAG: SusD/RagB family nutrient-binding outer membrane lipoprotein [Bacteroidales bacterium]
MSTQFISFTPHGPGKWATVLAMIFLVTGCNLDTMTEEDQREPMDLLEEALPIGQSNLVYWQMDKMNRYTSIWMQHLGGVRGTEESVDRYNLNPTHTDEIWSNFYIYIFPYIESLIVQGEEAGSYAYKGIGRVMKAYAFLIMTDTFGDIPYTNAAFYHDASQMPDYDPQETIIMELSNELEQAASDLYQAIDQGETGPGEEIDHIYGGDLQLWIKAANTLRMRLTLRSAHRYDSYDMLEHEFTGNDLFTGNEDNMLYRFPDFRNNPNLIHTYNQRIRNVRIGTALADRLKSNDDPRLPRLVKLNVNNNYMGTAPGESNYNASYHGDAVAGEDSPFPLITYAELKFIQAEVFFRTGQQQLADQAFSEGVSASLEFYEAEDPDPEWEATYMDIDNVTLEQIMEAKYIALAYTPEAWADYRRTGYPELTPYEEASEMIPRRMLYPEDELNHNSENVPAEVTMYDRVWWDVTE